MFLQQNSSKASQIDEVIKELQKKVKGQMCEYSVHHLQESHEQLDLLLTRLKELRN